MTQNTVRLTMSQAVARFSASKLFTRFPTTSYSKRWVRRSAVSGASLSMLRIRRPNRS